VPVNCRATVVLPSGYTKNAKVDGKEAGDKAILELGSGKYCVASE